MNSPIEETKTKTVRRITSVVVDNEETTTIEQLKPAVRRTSVVVIHEEVGTTTIEQLKPAAVSAPLKKKMTKKKKKTNQASSSTTSTTGRYEDPNDNRSGDCTPHRPKRKGSMDLVDVESLCLLAAVSPTTLLAAALSPTTTNTDDDDVVFVDSIQPLSSALSSALSSSLSSLLSSSSSSLPSSPSSPLSPSSLKQHRRHHRHSSLPSSSSSSLLPSLEQPRRQHQYRHRHPRRRYINNRTQRHRRSSASSKTQSMPLQEKPSSSSNSPPTRKISRSTSLNTERPSMKKSGTMPISNSLHHSSRCIGSPTISNLSVSADCPILRPYRQLSIEDLYIGEGSEENLETSWSDRYDDQPAPNAKFPFITTTPNTPVTTPITTTTTSDTITRLPPPPLFSTAKYSSNFDIDQYQLSPLTKYKCRSSKNDSVTKGLLHDQKQQQQQCLLLSKENVGQMIKSRSVPTDLLLLSPSTNNNKHPTNTTILRKLSWDNIIYNDDYNDDDKGNDNTNDNNLFVC